MPAEPDPNTTTSRPKYYAVITYVPEEFIWCDWLHGQLDGVTVPVDLAEKRTKHGFTRPPVIHVFPDPRNPAHLARHVTSPPPSRHLVVICSPHSVKSPALEEQIRAFKRTEGEDRIVVLVADGDPAHDDAPPGADDAAWLPAWIRWRLDKKGNFRPAEASEPQIVDARANKLEPPEARAHLLAALLDVPREKLRAYGDLVTASATATLTAAAADEAETVRVFPKQPKRGPGGLLAVVGLVVAVAAGAWWWSTQTGADSPAAAEATPLAVTATPLPATSAATPAIAPTPTSRPVAAAQATSTPTIRSVAATPPLSSPAPAPMVVAKTVTPKPSSPTSAPVTIAKMATPTPTPARPPAPPKKVITAFAPSEGPQTSMTNAPAAVPMKIEPGSSWQRMRDLGDTLLTRDNRDTGMIALTQAVAIGLRAATSPDTTLDERLDIARLCFRVGALQKQFVSPAEARRTLTSGRTLLEQLSISDIDRLAERDRLIADLDQLLGSIR